MIVKQQYFELLQYLIKLHTICIMLKKFLLISALLLTTTGCTLQQSRAGIEIKSTPSNSKIYINDKEVGKTPYKDDTLKAGEYTIKIQNENNSWSQKITLSNKTITYINRELASTPEDSSGEIVSLERGKGITVLTSPSQVVINLDGQKQGNSPYLIPNVTAGEHTLLLEKESYLTKKLQIKAIENYKIVIEAQLKKNPTEEVTPSPTTQPSTSPEASSSASPTTSTKPSPSATTSASPNPSSSNSKQTLTILSTETGWLRVRSKPSSYSEEIAKVNTGETFPYQELTSGGWYLITLTDNSQGYVSSRYVKVNK